MNRLKSAALVSSSVLALAVSACGPSGTTDAPGAGGADGTGGAVATGGVAATGGVPGSGGVSSSGGALGGGGTPGTGGVASGGSAAGGTGSGGGAATGGADGSGGSGEPELHIYLAVGQSNMQGAAHVPATPPFHERVQVLQSETCPSGDGNPHAYG